MNIVEKTFTKEEVLLFNENDWNFERSSGYSGQRNINTESPEYNKWIYLKEYYMRKLVKMDYYEDYELLHNFRLECLPFGEYPDYVIQEFLNKKYFKETEL